MSSRQRGAANFNVHKVRGVERRRPRLRSFCDHFRRRGRLRSMDLLTREFLLRRNSLDTPRFSRYVYCCLGDTPSVA